MAPTRRGGGRLGPLAEREIRVSHMHLGRVVLDMVVLHLIGYHFMEAQPADGSAPAS
jgi:hypothetical protein